MKVASIRSLTIAAVVLVALTAVALPLARSQVMATPIFVPIGVSSSGNASTAWFHEPSSGRAMACQSVSTPSAGLTGIQCVTAKFQ